MRGAVMRADATPVLAAIGVVAGARAGEMLGAAAGHGPFVVTVLATLLAACLRRSGRVLAVAVVALVILAAGALGAAAMQRALDGMAHSPFDAARATSEAVLVRGTLVGDPLVSRWDTQALV